MAAELTAAFFLLALSEMEEYKKINIVLIGLLIGLVGCNLCSINTEHEQVSREVLNHYDNLSYGIPAESDVLIDRVGYALGYKKDWKQATWVMYRLTREEVTSNEVQRMSTFAKDPLIRDGYSTPFDYLYSGYDKGHLAPAADMSWSQKAMMESFYMSNVSPQKPEFNRGIWCTLETWVREVAKRETNIVVVTGPIVVKDDLTNTIGRNKVVVPTAFFKVIYDETPPEKMIGFVIANEGSKLPISKYAVSVDSVEEVARLDFFNVLDNDTEERLESEVDFSLW